ncbi:hypothetical protein ACO0LD_23470 [Undibacterium sp. Ji83W]|uniref:hypothetical protein n=1 Tax=Undibacterium sp. Ji83W TaxID=3413043 RepID=UPI003BF1B175
MSEPTIEPPPVDQQPGSNKVLLVEQVVYKILLIAIGLGVGTVVGFIICLMTDLIEFTC